MIKFLGKTAAVSATLAMSAVAANAQTSGVDGFVQLELSYGTFDFPGNDWDEEYNPWKGYGFEGVVRYDISSNLSVMLDVQSFSTSNKTVPGDEYTVDGTMVAAHVNWALDGGSVGAFGGILTTNEWYEEPDNKTENSLLGVQANWILADNIIIDGEIAVIEQTDGYYGMGTVTNTHIGVQYFVQDNLFLGASVGVMSGQLGDDDGEDVNAASWSLETGYQLEQMPVSFFANVVAMNDSDWWGDDADGVVNTSLGVRYAFGAGSLKEQNMRYNQVADLSAFSWLRNDGNW